MPPLVDAAPYRTAGLFLWRKRTLTTLAMMTAWPGIDPWTVHQILSGKRERIRQSTAVALTPWMEAYERENV